MELNEVRSPIQMSLQLYKFGLETVGKCHLAFHHLQLSFSVQFPSWQQQ